jgi:hypothetical protein
VRKKCILQGSARDRELEYLPDSKAPRESSRPSCLYFSYLHRSNIKARLYSVRLRDGPRPPPRHNGSLRTPYDSDALIFRPTQHITTADYYQSPSRRNAFDSIQTVLRSSPETGYAMAPSAQVNRRTSKKDLAKRLNEIAKKPLESHDREVLQEACSIKSLVTWKLSLHFG